MYNTYMKVITMLDSRMLEDGWKKRIETTFSKLDHPSFIHAENTESAIRLLKKRGPQIIIFGSGDGKEKTYLQLLPHLRKNHMPILLTSDLNKELYRQQFRQQTGLSLEILDTLNYYDNVKPLLERISALGNPRSAEIKS